MRHLNNKTGEAGAALKPGQRFRLFTSFSFFFLSFFYHTIFTGDDLKETKWEIPSWLAQTVWRRHISTEKHTHLGFCAPLISL